MKSVLLLILDGFGLAPLLEGNAVAQAKTPILDALSRQARLFALHGAGEAVGLPWGVIGNSEVGHTTMGAGRVVLQDYPQINQAIQNGTFFRNQSLLDTVDHVKKNNSTLHVMGICSNAGVHGYIDHIIGVIELAKRSGLNRLGIHLITDGRDTPPQSGQVFVGRIKQAISQRGVGTIATLVGRYWAMDRDKNWDRIKLAYDALTLSGKSPSVSDPVSALKAAYQTGQNDENLKPIILESQLRLKSLDGLIFTNFRSDRAIQLTKALADPKFDNFALKPLNNFKMVTMTTFEDSNLPTLTAFSAIMLANPQTNPTDQPLGQIVDQAGLTQVRIAETEKSAHVTQFFDLGRADPYSTRDRRIIVPSKKVSSFAQAPEMSAAEIAYQAEKVMADRPNLMVINLANADMVGHTGDFKATLKAVEILDRVVGQLVSQAQSKDIDVMITADHGNAEAMVELDGYSSNKEHSINPVPFLIVTADRPVNLTRTRPLTPNQKRYLATEPIGLLADVAPTVLKRLGLPPSPNMTGMPLVED